MKKEVKKPKNKQATNPYKKGGSEPKVEPETEVQYY
jgi:hypothetical protein